MSLIVSCCDKFEEMCIEINNNPEVTASLNTSLRQFFYNLNKNKKFQFLKFSYNNGIITYKPKENSVMMLNIRNSFTLYLWQFMCEHLKANIENLHLNFTKTNLINQYNIFEILSDKGNKVNNKIKYVSLNLSGFNP